MCRLFPPRAVGRRPGRRRSTPTPRPTRARARSPRCLRPPSTTTRGSSSPRARRAFRRAWRSRTAARRRSSTPRRTSSCRMRPWRRGIVCSRDSQSPSTRRARRCGSRGATAPASSPRRGRSCAPATISPRGCFGRASPRSRPFRPSRRCGRAARSRTFVCSSSGARRVLPNWPRVWLRRTARSGTPTVRPRRPSWPALHRSEGTVPCGSACRWTDGCSRSSTPTGTGSVKARRESSSSAASASPATWTLRRTRRSTRRCPRSAGSARTVRAISCATSVRGSSSRGAPTIR